MTLEQAVARVDELLKLEDGWLDGEGVAIKPKYGRWLKRRLMSRKRKRNV